MVSATICVIRQSPSSLYLGSRGAFQALVADAVQRLEDFGTMKVEVSSRRALVLVCIRVTNSGALLLMLLTSTRWAPRPPASSCGFGA